MLDFTKAPQSAFAFAGFGDTNVGRVAVLSVKQYLWGGHGGFGLVDMSRHKWAERAQRQDAFGLVMLNRLDDLKSDAVRESLSLLRISPAQRSLGRRTWLVPFPFGGRPGPVPASWYEFKISDKDRADLKEEYERLTSISNDPSAGFLRYHITEYVEAYGKFPEIVAEWLLEKIPIAPQCYLVKGFDGSDAIVHYRGYDALSKLRPG